LVLKNKKLAFKKKSFVDWAKCRAYSWTISSAQT